MPELTQLCTEYKKDISCLDLTTGAFLASLKRLFSTEERQHIETIEKNEKFSKFLTSEGVTWRFISPRTPHHGWLWEAAVMSSET